MPMRDPPLLALSGHSKIVDPCSLSGVKFLAKALSTHDPKRTFGLALRGVRFRG